MEERDDSTPPVGGIPLVIYVFAFSAFALGFTEFVTIGLVSTIAADLTVGVDQVGAAVAAYAIGATIGAPILTALAASWSRKRLLLAAMVVFTIGNVLVGLSDRLPALLAARFGSGLGHGVFLAVASSAATRLVAPERAGTAVAVVFGGLTLALASACPSAPSSAASGHGRPFSWASRPAAQSVSSGFSC